MKFVALALVLFGAVALSTGQIEPEALLESYNPVRFRREADPQGSLDIHAQKPLNGPDRRPSLDVNYRQRVFERNGANLNAYGGLNIRPGQPPQPHIGMHAERNFNNGGFIRGYGQVERGPGGGASPSYGLKGGFRFRRNVQGAEQQQY